MRLPPFFGNAPISPWVCSVDAADGPQTSPRRVRARPRNAEDQRAGCAPFSQVRQGFSVVTSTAKGFFSSTRKGSELQILYRPPLASGLPPEGAWQPPIGGGSTWSRIAGARSLHYGARP
jgi:hypothetical protein